MGKWMGLVKFKFTSTRPGQTVRERELENSARRSHAARAVHEARRHSFPHMPSSSRGRVGKKSGNLKDHNRRPHSSKNISEGNPTIPFRHDSKSLPLQKNVEANIAIGKTTPKILLPRPFRGNSDPFSSMSIEISPRETATLHFVQNEVMPAIYHNQYAMRTSGIDCDVYAANDSRSLIFEPIITEMWRNIMNAMHHRGSAMALMASTLSQMTKVTPLSAEPQLRQYALVLSTHSSSLFRAELSHWTPGVAADVDERLLMQLLHLFKTSCWLGDRPSAVLYGAILSEVFEKGIEGGTIQPLNFCLAGIDDLDLALKSVCRPLLRYEWFRVIITPFWESAEKIVPQPGIGSVLHSDVQHHRLRQLFHDARVFNAYAECAPPPSAWGPPEQRVTALVWTATKCMTLLGGLLNLYFDLRSKSYLEPGLTAGRHILQVAFTLALAHYHHISAHSMVIGGINIRDQSASVMDQLRSDVEQMEARSSVREYQDLVDGRLWILFLGACWERRMQKSSDEGWWQNKLVHEALRADKGSWSALQPTLAAFLYVTWIKPPGSSWFDSLVYEVKLGKNTVPDELPCSISIGSI